ncbi:MAG: hypothetical protein NTV36_01600 [Candidatus Staskawiczbacteria bacterium]|nr:hypothetical protein [Candidatus Staskawiczbacteria bacterium]
MYNKYIVSSVTSNRKALMAPDERDARRRLIKALENKSSNRILDDRIVTAISRSTLISTARLRQLEDAIMIQETIRRC